MRINYVIAENQSMLTSCTGFYIAVSECLPYLLGGFSLFKRGGISPNFIQNRAFTVTASQATTLYGRLASCRVLTGHQLLPAHVGDVACNTTFTVGH